MVWPDMDEFLRIVYEGHTSQIEVGNKCYDVFFKPFFNRLHELVNDKVFEELDELFTICAIDNNSYYGVEGMKIAIQIQNNTYVAPI